MSLVQCANALLYMTLILLQVESTEAVPQEVSHAKCNAQAKMSVQLAYRELLIST